MSERAEITFRMFNEMSEWGFSVVSGLEPFGNGGYMRVLSFVDKQSKLTGYMNIYQADRVSLFIQTPHTEEAAYFDLIPDEAMNDLADVRDTCRQEQQVLDNVNQAQARVTRSMDITYTVHTESHGRFIVVPEDGGKVRMRIDDAGEMFADAVMRPEQVQQAIDALTMALDNI